MKYLFTSILIISFVGIAILGFSIFNHGMSNADYSCVTSPIDGTVCPTNIVAMTLDHISTLQALTISVTPLVSSLLLLLASLLLILFLVFIFYKYLLYPKLELLFQRFKNLVFNFLYSQRKIISWLSLLENSPSVS